MADALALVKIDLVVTKIADGTAAAATIRVNLRGTGTAATIFSSNTGAAQVNPFTVANGRIEVWVYEGSYDLVISGTGFTTYTQEFEAIHAQGLPAGLGPFPCAASTIPLGWTICDGRLLDGTTALYNRLWNAIGTTYGGTGQSSFKLPDLRGKSPIGTNNVGLPGGRDTNYTIYNAGNVGGVEAVTLSGVQSGVNGNGVTAGKPTGITVGGSATGISISPGGDHGHDVSTFHANPQGANTNWGNQWGPTTFTSGPPASVVNYQANMYTSVVSGKTFGSGNHTHGVGDPGHGHTVSDPSHFHSLTSRAADASHTNIHPVQAFPHIIKL